MQIVIDIDEKDYRDFQLQAVMLNPAEPSQRAKLAIANGKPLPKGHGRLKDVDDMELPPEELISRMIVAEAPTIIEADKEGAEE